jgi:hypothetical protein
MNSNVEILRLREQYKADIISIFVPSIPLGTGIQNFAGFVAQIPGLAIQEEVGAKRRIESGKDNSFMFLGKETVASSPYLLAHELGHLLGGLHFAEINKPEPLTPRARYGYSSNEPIEPTILGANQPINTIMAFDGKPSVHLFSSPELKLPGAFYAYNIAENLPNSRLLDAYDARFGLGFVKLDLKSLATHDSDKLPLEWPPKLPFLNTPRAMGTIDRNNVTATIDYYAPIIAAYRSSKPRIILENVPSNLKKGEKAIITLRLSVCEGNFYQVLLDVISRSQGITPINQRIDGGAERILTYQVTMPNDADYLGVQGSVALVRLEKYGNSSYEFPDNSSSDFKFFHIFCSDCTPAIPKKNRVALQSWSPSNSRYDRNRVEVLQPVVFPVTPNPVADGRAELRLFLPRAFDVRLTLVSTLGQTLAEYIYPQMNPGEHTLTLPVDNLPSGSYISRITIGEQTFRQTLVIIK